MKNSLNTYYRAYRLVKTSESHVEREWQETWDIYRGKRNARVNGKCRLKLIAERETMSDLLEEIPPVKVYLKNPGDGKDIVMKPFLLADAEELECISYRFGGCAYVHMAGRKYSLEPEKDFRMIYSSRRNGIIIVMDSWLADNIEKFSLDTKCRKEGKRASWTLYDVEFA